MANSWGLPELCLLKGADYNAGFRNKTDNGIALLEWGGSRKKPKVSIISPLHGYAGWGEAQ